MRFMILIRATQDSEAEVMPSARLPPSRMAAWSPIASEWVVWSLWRLERVGRSDFR